MDNVQTLRKRPARGRAGLLTGSIIRGVSREGCFLRAARPGILDLTHADDEAVVMDGAPERFG